MSAPCTPSKTRAALLLGLISLLTCTASLWARDGGRWSIRAYGVWLSPTGDEVVVDRSPAPGVLERTIHRVDESGTGFGLGLEYRWSERWSVELGALTVDLDNDFRLEIGGSVLADIESMGVESFFVGVDWHLTPERRVDFSLGLFLAQTTFDDVIFLTEQGLREKLTFDDDYGLGLSFGADLPLRLESPWFVSADVRYLATILESEIAGQDLDLDPLIVTVGIGYRF